MQSGHHPFQPASVVFLDANHPAAAAGFMVITSRVIPRNGVSIRHDPPVDLHAALSEHAKEVFGLASISGLDCRISATTSRDISAHWDNVTDRCIGRRPTVLFLREPLRPDERRGTI